LKPRDRRRVGCSGTGTRTTSLPQLRRAACARKLPNQGASSVSAPYLNACTSSKKAGLGAKAETHSRSPASWARGRVSGRSDSAHRLQSNHRGSDSPPGRQRRIRPPANAARGPQRLGGMSSGNPVPQLRHAPGQRKSAMSSRPRCAARRRNWRMQAVEARGILGRSVSHAGRLGQIASPRRMASSGAGCPVHKVNAAAPCWRRSSRPSCPRSPRACAARTSGVPPAA